MPYMKSLTSCLNKMISDGYTDDFKVKEEGMRSLRTEKLYLPADVDIVNFFRFEGMSNPDDMAIMYVIETHDGLKGTLIDAYGAYADPDVNQFILAVEKMKKKSPEG